MWKKMLLLSFSLALMAAANIRMCYAVSVCGRELEGLYSRRSVERGLTVSALAAEEILRGEVCPPLTELRLRPGIREPAGQIPELTDALLRATPGVGLSYAVYVKGQRLGAVSSDRALREELRTYIDNQLPTWAVSGHISESMTVTPQYGRVGRTTSTSDMVLLITGKAPVLYSDGRGYVSLA